MVVCEKNVIVKKHLGLLLVETLYLLWLEGRADNHRIIRRKELLACVRISISEKTAVVSEYQ